MPKEFQIKATSTSTTTLGSESNFEIGIETEKKNFLFIFFRANLN